MIGVVRNQVELSNCINLTDINIAAENFYRDFLNLIFKYQLHNANTLESNSEAIDLYDDHNSINIQVTSTSSSTKIKKTVRAFIEKNLHKRYDRLIILIITSKNNYRDDFFGEEGVYQIDSKKDVWDFQDLMPHINDMCLDEIVKVFEFLKKETGRTPDFCLPREINTFVNLIRLLSDESQASVGHGYLEAPDPSGKIERRFADHADFLKGQYVNLYSEYGGVLEDALDHADLGSARIRRLGLKLREFSDDILTRCDGHPQEALKCMVGEFSELLGKQGAEFDETAISFFLVHELIACNVFPNTESVDA
jgi:hypothetical protein